MQTIKNVIWAILMPFAALLYGGCCFAYQAKKDRKKSRKQQLKQISYERN